MHEIKRWITTIIERLDNRIAWRVFSRRTQREQRISAAFDQRYGTDTAEDVSLIDAGLPAQAAQRANGIYRVTWEWCFFQALRAISIDHRRFTFIDVGSGKGKLLLLASNLPFQRIIGFEIAPALHETALKNISTYKEKVQKCTRIEAHLADATQVELPQGPLVLMSVNAFDQDTMRAVLRNIEDQCKDTDRELYFIYVNMRRVAEMRLGFESATLLRQIRKSRHHIVMATPTGHASQRHAP